jgi:hypothetical protein
VDAPPFNTTAGFLARFVRPLLGGGPVEVEAPLSSHDRAQMLADAAPLLDPDFLHLRTRVAQRLVADPELPDPGADELSLWLGLHDVLALDHPDTERVWTRVATWRKVENETRALLAFARPIDVPDALARHLAVAAFLDLRREDHILTSPSGDLRLRGQAPPRRRFGLFSTNLGEVRTEVVRWVEAPHATIVDRLLPDVMWVSPLTSLLRPGWAPPGWTPLMAVEFLRERPYARAVCHTWAQAREWLRVGGVVAGSLLNSLELHAAVFGDVANIPILGAAVPGATPTMQRAAKAALEGAEPRTDPGVAASVAEPPFAALPAPPIASEPHDIGAVVGALIHLHVLKVLEFDARISIGLGARDWAVQTFLAMPLLLPSLAPTLGWPFELGGKFPGESGTQEPGESESQTETESERETESGTDEAGRGGAAPVDGGFARRWEEYTEHLAGLVPRNVVDNLQATLVRRIRG